jgi:hypothetical protein
MWKYYLFSGLAWSAGIHAYAAFKGQFNEWKKGATLFRAISGFCFHTSFWPLLLPWTGYKLATKKPIALTLW